jgi:hypothetical protein
MNIHELFVPHVDATKRGAIMEIRNKSPEIGLILEV